MYLVCKTRIIIDPRNQSHICTNSGHYFQTWFWKNRNGRTNICSYRLTCRRRTSLKIVIITGRDCGPSKWINSLINLPMDRAFHMDQKYSISHDKTLQLSTKPTPWKYTVKIVIIIVSDCGPAKWINWLIKLPVDRAFRRSLWGMSSVRLRPTSWTICQVWVARTSKWSLEWNQNGDHCFLPWFLINLSTISGKIKDALESIKLLHLENKMKLQYFEE